MDNEKRIKKLKEKDYQKYFGVSKATFDKMLKILDLFNNLPLKIINAAN